MMRFLADFTAWLRQRSLRRSRPTIDARAVLEQEASPPLPYVRGGSKPYTRWWWLAGPFRREDIRDQLLWLRSNGFGGVELAWLWPSWMGDAEPGISWLGPEWTDLIAFTKQEADRLGLGCDFTFGSCWPYGGSCVRPEDAARTFEGISRQRLRGSWENHERDDPYVLNHLDRGALRHYAEATMPAFAGGLLGSRSALFCDSLEIDTRRLWDPKLWDRFAHRFGYRLEGLEDQIDDDPDLRYDYRTLIAEAIVREFYEEFAEICREHGAIVEGPVPRCADRSARGLCGGGHPRVGGDPVRPTLFEDRGLGRRPLQQAGRQRRNVHVPVRLRHEDQPGALPVLA